MDASKFRRIAHGYLIFRDDWETIRSRLIGEPVSDSPLRWNTPTRKELLGHLKVFQNTIEQAEYLSMAAGEPILIMGPHDSVKEGLARAIAKADTQGGEVIERNCDIADEADLLMSECRDSKKRTTLIINNIEKAGSALQAILVELANPNSAWNGRLIFITAVENSAARNLKFRVDKGEFRAEILDAVRTNTLYMSSICYHPWDVAPLVISRLLEMPEAPVDYISYPSFVFLIWYVYGGRYRRPLGNVTRLEAALKKLAAFANQETGGLKAIRLDDLMKCWPRGTIAQILDYPPKDIYHLMNNWPSGGYPLTAYGLENLQNSIGSPEVIRFLMERTFFPKEGHKVTPPRGNWYRDKWECDPPYALEGLCFFPEFLETDSTDFGRYLSHEWLRNEDISEVQRFAGMPISLDDAEEILFDVGKMHRIFRKTGVLPDKTKKSSRPKFEPYMEVSNNYRNYRVFNGPRSRGKLYKISRMGRQTKIMKGLISNYRMTREMGMEQRALLEGTSVIKKGGKITQSIRQTFSGSPLWGKVIDAEPGSGYYYLKAKQQFKSK